MVRKPLLGRKAVRLTRLSDAEAITLRTFVALGWSQGKGLGIISFSSYPNPMRKDCYHHL